MTAYLSWGAFPFLAEMVFPVKGGHLTSIVAIDNVSSMKNGFSMSTGKRSGYVPFRNALFLDSDPLNHLLHS